MEVSGSLLDDQQLNESIESTVQKILGNMNQLMDRLTETSTNCTLSLLRVDTIAADVNSLKTEKSVIHTIVRDPPKPEVNVATTHRTSLDMLIDKINEMDDGWCEASLEKFSAPVNFELRARLLSEDQVEASSSTVESVPEMLPALGITAETHETSHEDTRKEIDTPEPVPSKKLFSDTSDSENEAKNLQKSEKKIEQTSSNGLPDFRKELAARFATPISVSPKNLFSDDSEQESSSPPPKISNSKEVTRMNSSDLQKELLAEIVKSKTKPKKKIFSDESDSDTVNDESASISTNVQTSGKETKINGVNDTHPESPVEKALSHENGEKISTQKPATNGGLTIQQELSAKFAQKNSTTKNIVEDKSKPENNVPISKSNGNKDNDSPKPAPPGDKEKKTLILNGTVSITKSSDISEKSVTKTNGASTKSEVKKVVPKKFSLLDDSDSDDDLFKKPVAKKTSVININPPTNNGAQKSVEVVKPKPVLVKSLLDSDSDDADSLFQKKPILIKPKLSNDISQASEKLVETKKEQHPKKVSKSIFLDSDSDDELFKPKTVKPEPVLTKTAESSDKKPLPGKIQNSNFASDLNTLLSKAPTSSTSQIEQSKPEVESTDNLTTILKSRPKAPTSRRPRGATSQKPPEPTVNEIPFFDPLS